MNGKLGLRSGATGLFVFAVALGLLLLPLGSAFDSGAAQPLGWVVGVNGAPTLTRAGNQGKVHRGTAVVADDLIETNASSKVKLFLRDDSVLTVGPRSSFKFTEALIERDQRKVKLKILAGRFKMAIAKFFGGESDVEITTPTAVAGVRGTVVWGDTELDAMCSLEGAVTVRPASKGDADAATLKAGECVGAMGEGKTTPLSPTPEDLAKYLAEVTLE